MHVPQEIALVFQVMNVRSNTLIDDSPTDGVFSTENTASDNRSSSIDNDWTKLKFQWYVLKKTWWVQDVLRWKIVKTMHLIFFWLPSFFWITAETSKTGSMLATCSPAKLILWFETYLGSMEASATFRQQVKMG